MQRFGFSGLPDAELTVSVGLTTSVEVVIASRGIRRSLGLGSDAHLQLHWACALEDGLWVAPASQPPGSRAVDAVASRVSLDQGGAVRLGFGGVADAPEKIVFVVLVEAKTEQHWLKSSSGDDFLIDLTHLIQAAAAKSPAVQLSGGLPLGVAERSLEWPALVAAKEAVAAAELAAVSQAAAAKSRRRGARGAAVKHVEQSEGDLSVEGGRGSVLWHVARLEESVTVFIETKLLLPEGASLKLHWGGQESLGGEWFLPASTIPDAEPVGDGKASRTALEGQARAILKFQPADSAPGGIAFVLFAKLPDGTELWLKDSAGKDFAFPVLGHVYSTQNESVAQQFCDAETKYSNWSHFQRIGMANGILAKSLGLTEAAWLACDLRLAQGKALDWYRNRGYQPKDMAFAQEALGRNLAAACCQPKITPLIRTLLRLCTPAVTTGNAGGGDAIRHGILNIMRNHGIKEGHRPGIECKFIEQWHQKLHTNSAPDDIVICEGYLAFLRSGNVDDMWRTIWERGQISREDLAKMCTCGFVDHTKSGVKGLNVAPLHLPQLYHDMQGYLGLLKHVHGGTDLLSLCESCKGQYPDHDAERLAFEIFHCRDDPFSMGKVVELRRRLAPALCQRNILLLDAAMEAQLRALAERADLVALPQESLLAHVTLLLQDLQISRQDDSLESGVAFWLRLVAGDAGGLERWSPEWCKLLHAACDRLALVAASTADAVASLLQGCADQLSAAGQQLGAVFTPAHKHLHSFGEETARCLTERLVAQSFQRLMPMLRQAAGLGPWEVVSSGQGAQAVGEVVVMRTLPAPKTAANDDAQTTPAPQIALLESMTGWEDIPAEISAILLPAAQAVDTLSHVAIRARNQHVLLASCDDEEQLIQLRALKGILLKVEVQPSGGVTWSKVDAVEAESSTKATSLTGLIKVQVPPAPHCQVLRASDFEANRRCLGGKSLHLAELQPKNDEYLVPASITIPFGVCEEVLKTEAANDGIVEELHEIVATGNWAEARKFFIEEVEVPDSLQEALQKELKHAGAPPLDCEAGWKVALKSVWASKWSDRAVSSRRHTGIPDSALYLAVLVQPLMASKYAFVLHTKSPLVGAEEDEQLIEICIGLGESLVSNSPGRALSASVADNGHKVVVHTYPSKPDGVFAPEGVCHIFRSDSNGEDLEGFAGAGLYDSVTTKDCLHRTVSYANEALLFDQVYRQKLLLSLFELGRRVEARFKAPQDIEGAVLEDGTLVVTQSRPQV